MPQEASLLAGTIKDNIARFQTETASDVRGLDEEVVRVAKLCGAHDFILRLPQAYDTMLGPDGVGLSVGQAQRIALARAAYSRADLYVLDSPLSAVDMYTCQHIFKHCIQDLMIASGGTVVLATHQTELFHFSNHLVVMEEGDLAYNAPYRFEGIKHLFPNISGEGEESRSDKKDEKKPSKQSRAAAEYDKHKPKASTKKAAKVVEKKEKETSTEGIYTWYIKKLGVWSFTGATLFFIAAQVMRVYR